MHNMVISSHLNEYEHLAQAVSGLRKARARGIQAFRKGRRKRLNISFMGRDTSNASQSAIFLRLGLVTGLRVLRVFAGETWWQLSV
jgi:hypothetical protein